MAATETTKILKLEIDVDAVTTQQAKILEQQKELKKSMKEYNDAQKTEAGATAEQTKAFIDSQAQMKNLSTEYRQNTTLLASRQAVEANGITTINDAKKALAAVSIEWARSTKIEGENSEKTKQLAANKLALTDRLKELESTTGDNTRNVGNYSGALEGLQGKLTGATGGLGGLASGFMNAAKSGTLLKTGLGLIRGAFMLLAANPLVAILAGMVTLFLSLKKVIAGNEEQTQKLNKIMAPFKFVLDGIMNVVQLLVDGFLNLAEGFSNAGAALLDFIGIQTASNEKAKDAIALTEKQAELEKQKRESLIQNAEDDLALTKLRAEAADKENVSAEQRIEKLKEADKLAKEIADRNVKDAKAEFEILDQLAARNKSSKADLDALAAAKAKVAEAEKSQYTIGITLAGQMNAAIKEVAAEQAAADKERQEKQTKANQVYISILNYQLNYYKATNESKLNSEVELTDKLIAEEKARVGKIFDLETKANEKSYSLGLISKQDYELAKIAIQKTADEGTAAIIDARINHEREGLSLLIREFQLTNKTKIDSSKELNEELIANETLRLNDLAELQMQEIEMSDATEREKALKKLEIQQQSNEAISNLNAEFAEIQIAKRKEQQILDIESDAEINRNNILAQFEFERTELEKQYADKVAKAEGNNALIIKLEQAKAAALKDINQRELDSKFQMASNFANLLASALGKQTALGKAAASAGVAIDTISGAIKAFNAYAEIPIVGPALGAVAAAAVGVTGAMAIKDIWAVKTGLPGDSGGGGGASSINVDYSGVGTTGQQALAQDNTNNDGGYGTSTIGGSSGVSVPATQTVLVVDDVTAAQMSQARIASLATM